MIAYQPGYLTRRLARNVPVTGGGDVVRPLPDGDALAPIVILLADVARQGTV